MIIYHQNNVAAFVGAHTYYWPLQPLLYLYVSIALGPTPGGPTGSQPYQVYSHSYSYGYGH